MKNNDPGYVFMYTCNETGNPTDITVAIWIPAEDYFTQGISYVKGI